MPSDKAKGTQVEKRLETALLDAGWRVHRARSVSKQLVDYKARECFLCHQKPRGRFVVLSNDLWGVFDLACLRSDSAPLMIQACSTPSDASHRRKKLEAWTEGYDYGVDVMVITWNSRTAAIPAEHRNKWRVQLLLQCPQRWTSAYYTTKDLSWALASGAIASTSIGHPP